MATFPWAGAVRARAGPVQSLCTSSGSGLGKQRPYMGGTTAVGGPTGMDEDAWNEYLTIGSSHLT